MSNPANPALFFEEEFQFDATAVYSFVPEWRLEKIEIRPSLVRESILPSDRREMRLAGECLFTGLPMLEPRVCPIIFRERILPVSSGFEDLTSEEIASRMSESASSKPAPTFEKGESVKIIDGPFAGFTGIVDEIHSDLNTVKILEADDDQSAWIKTPRGTSFQPEFRIRHR